MDSAARAATNEARSCELPSDRRGPVRHCSLTGVAHGQGVGVSALRNGAFRFAPLMSRSTSAFRVRSQSEPRARRRCRLRGPRRRSNPGPPAYPSEPRSTSQKIRKSSTCRHFKRLMGLEPTTFCMASRPSLRGHNRFVPANGQLLRRGGTSFFPRVSSRFDGIVSPNCPRGSCTAGARRTRAHGTRPKSPARMPSTGRHASLSECAATDPPQAVPC
jgi:hypothetical protein